MDLAFSGRKRRFRASACANGPATYLPDSGNTGPISLPVNFDVVA